MWLLTCIPAHKNKQDCTFASYSTTCLIKGNQTSVFFPKIIIIRHKAVNHIKTSLFKTECFILAYEIASSDLYLWNFPSENEKENFCKDQNKTSTYTLLKK